MKNFHEQNSFAEIWFNTPCLQQGKPSRRTIKSIPVGQLNEKEFIERAKGKGLMLTKTPTQYILAPTTGWVVLYSPPQA